MSSPFAVFINLFIGPHAGAVPLNTIFAFVIKCGLKSGSIKIFQENTNIKNLNSSDITNNYFHYFNIKFKIIHNFKFNYLDTDHGCFCFVNSDLKSYFATGLKFLLHYSFKNLNYMSNKIN